jgi:putative transposase
MILAHKICLDPTVKQEIALAKAAGTARYTWNWALAECERQYRATGKTANLSELKVFWNKSKPTWTKESPKDANQQPFADLQKAYGRFFKNLAGKPKFKCKGRSKDSFYVSNDKLKLEGKLIRLPKIGRVRMRETLRFVGKVMSARVSRTAGKWYVSVAVEVPAESKPGTEVLGIDLGLKTFAILSTGELFEAPKPLKKTLDKLRRLSRRHSSKQKGSENRKKAAAKLAKHHAKVTNIRKDFLHKLSTLIVSRAKIVSVEDLSVRGMQKMYGRAAADIGMYEFRRQITYKCKKSDVGCAVVNRWYPSSQLCSRCGQRQKLTLADREYKCRHCGLDIDRDHNAAINISTAGYAGINACGHEGSDDKTEVVVKPSWSKQELNRCQVNTLDYK